MFTAVWLCVVFIGYHAAAGDVLLALNASTMALPEADLSSRFDIRGSARVVTTESGRPVLRLTTDAPAQQGYLSSQDAVVLSPSNWALDVDVRVHGAGVSLYGDGLALWLTERRFSPGPGWRRCPPWPCRCVPC